MLKFQRGSALRQSQKITLKICFFYFLYFFIFNYFFFFFCFFFKFFVFYYFSYFLFRFLFVLTLKSCLFKPSVSEMKFLESIETEVFHVFAIFMSHLQNFRDVYQFDSRHWFNLGGQKFSHSVVLQE